MTSVSAAKVNKIAKSKGLTFSYNKAHDIYVMCDRLTGECLMTYAPVTIALTTNEKVWREECNKLRTAVNR